MPVRHAIRYARPSALRPTWCSGQERFDWIPQWIGKQRRGHTRSRYFAGEDQGKEYGDAGKLVFRKVWRDYSAL